MRHRHISMISNILLFFGDVFLTFNRTTCEHELLLPGLCAVLVPQAAAGRQDYSER